MMSSVSGMDESADMLEASPLQAPPVVIIPGKQIPRHVVRRSESVSEMETSTVPPVTPVEDTLAPGEEKVGRWSENEHKIFLDGLEQYGKQWKTISQLIGTRTVVQVRTHAQKYFQKLERKNKNKAPAVPLLSSRVSKRKSLPSSLPSRKKANKAPSSPVAKTMMTRTQSLSLANVRSSSSSSSSSEIRSSYSSSLSSGNLSTDSPTGVNELDLQSSPGSSSPEAKEPLFLVEDPIAPQPETDPLDWLIADGANHLPESSLDQSPIFPDLSEDKFVLGQEPQTSEAAATSTLAAAPASLSYPVLQEIADPKVTVQSLFVHEDGDAHQP